MGTVSMKKSDRVYWIDLAKFIGIAAIVYGHTIQEGYTCKYVYSFHVPLFFFLQGIVFSLSNGEKKPFGQYVKGKAYTLLLPYYAFAIISSVVIFLASRFIAVPEADIFSSVKDLLRNITIGDCDANRPLWFLPCSFVLSILSYTVINLTDRFKKTIYKKWALAAVAVLGGAALYVTEEYTSIKFLPWKLDTAIHMLPFFIAGYALYEYGWIKRIERLTNRIKLLAAALLIIVGALLGLYNGDANYLGNYYGNIIIFFASAFASCAGWCLLVMGMPEIRILSYTGKSTLSILLMHKFPVLFFQKVLPITKDLLDRQSVPVAVLVTLTAIALCCIAQSILERLCPFLIGKYRSKKTQTDPKAAID